MLKTYDERNTRQRLRAALISLTGARRSDRAAEPKLAQDNQEGPPDLDQMWRDFNKRLNRLFGRKEGGTPPSGGSGSGGGAGGGGDSAAVTARVTALGSRWSL